MDVLESHTHGTLLSRRTVVRTGLRLAYAAPVVSVSFSVASLTASADQVSIAEADLAAEVVNQAPVAVAGDGFEVTDEDGDGFADVPLDGTGSADPDGTIVKYVWSRQGKWLSNDPVTTARLPIGTHRIVLTVTDNSGNTAESKIRIRVKAGAEKPEAPDSEPALDTQTQPAEPAPEPTAPPLPPAPFEVEAKQKLAEVAITWKVQPESAPPYRVYRCVDDGTLDDGREHTAEEIDGFAWILIREEYEKLSYRDGDIQVGASYLYSVRAFDGTNESERSNIARITVKPVEQEPVEENPPPSDTPTPVPDTPTPEPTVADTPTPEPETSGEESGESETPTEEDES